MKSNTLKTALGITFISLFVTLSHAQVQEASEKDWKQFNNTTVKQFVIPAYETLASSAKALYQNTQKLCISPSQETLDKSRKDFHQTMDAWQAIQNITFGPIEFAMRSHSMQFWPDKKNHIGKHLAKLLKSNDPSQLAEDKFQSMSISVKGLPAIERILYSQTALEELKSEGFRCEVLIRISENVYAISSALYAEWSEHMREQFADAKQLDGYFEDDIDAATALLKTMIEPLEVIRDLKLQRAMGSAFGKEKFKRLESWRSERSLRNIEKNITTLHEMFTGMDGKSGLSPLLPKDVFQDITGQYEKLLSTLSRFDQPLEKIIQTKEGYLSLVKIHEDLGLLHKQLEQTAADLGIHLGFNSRDGD